MRSPSTAGAFLRTRACGSLTTRRSGTQVVVLLAQRLTMQSDLHILKRAYQSYCAQMGWEGAVLV